MLGGAPTTMLSAGFATSSPAAGAPGSSAGGAPEEAIAEAGCGTEDAARSGLFASFGRGLARPGSRPRRESMNMPLIPLRGVPAGGLRSSVTDGAWAWGTAAAGSAAASDAAAGGPAPAQSPFSHDQGMTPQEKPRGDTHPPGHGRRPYRGVPGEFESLAVLKGISPV